jgi:hypothetical protein
MPRPLRIAVLVMALVAMLGIVTASASPAHAHLKTPDAGCDICITAHFSAMETPAALIVHSPDIQGHITFLALLSGYQPCDSESTSSRGPPALVS